MHAPQWPQPPGSRCRGRPVRWLGRGPLVQRRQLSWPWQRLCGKRKREWQPPRLHRMTTTATTRRSAGELAAASGGGGVACKLGRTPYPGCGRAPLPAAARLRAALRRGLPGALRRRLRVGRRRVWQRRRLLLRLLSSGSRASLSPRAAETPGPLQGTPWDRARRPQAQQPPDCHRLSWPPARLHRNPRRVIPCAARRQWRPPPPRCCAVRRLRRRRSRETQQRLGAPTRLQRPLRPGAGRGRGRRGRGPARPRRATPAVAHARASALAGQALRTQQRRPTRGRHPQWSTS
jgi:hypothetical protein